MNIDGNFLRQVAVGDGDGDIGDISNLRGEVPGDEVDVLRRIFPNAADISNLSLAAQLTFGADLTRHPSNFGGKAAQLIDHGVDGFFELENFAAHVDGDLFG